MLGIRHSPTFLPTLCPPCPLLQVVVLSPDASEPLQVCWLVFVWWVLGVLVRCFLCVAGLFLAPSPSCPPPQSLDADKVYVVGGIVDRTVQSNITQSYAVRKGGGASELLAARLITHPSLR